MSGREEDYTDGLCEIGNPMPKNATGSWWHSDIEIVDGKKRCLACGDTWPIRRRRALALTGKNGGSK
jgi:hypothetical protein